MQLARWMIGVAILFPAVAVMAGNWTVLARAILRPESKVPSWIPLLGGTLAAIGFLMVPNPRLHRLWWLGLVLDWGSAPGLVYTGVWHLRRILKKAQ